jgi:hypothetical protein
MGADILIITWLGLQQQRPTRRLVYITNHDFNLVVTACSGTQLR